MRYYNLSENIIACDNFLPSQKIDELYSDLLNNRQVFSPPSWSNETSTTTELFSEKCGGLDFWLNNKTKQDNNSFIESVHKWMMHQGFEYYVKDNGAKVYDFLKRKLEWDIHVISYNNGGYYNWHKDISMSTLFTFNLILNKGDTLKGGDLLFYDREIIEVENKNNFLVVFPSYIPHAIKPVYTEDKNDVPFLEQRFSIQFWVRFKND